MVKAFLRPKGPNSSWVSISILVFGCLALSSCASVRGLPSHGGGKRFDEEQRMLSSSIKTAIDSLDFSHIKGKKVRLFLDALETSGSGRDVFPGFRSINPSLNVREQGGSDVTTINYPLGYNIDPNYWGNNNLTSRDMKYLEFMLKMRCRLEGVQLVTKGQDVDLLIAVDVLGSNRSRDDHLLVVRDHLGVATELTYCCIDAKTGKVLLGRKTTGAKANYTENWMRLTNFKISKRSLQKGIAVSYGEEQQARLVAERVESEEPLKSNISKHKNPEEKSDLGVELVNGEDEQGLSEDDLYQQGLDAVSRKDRKGLGAIIDKLKKAFSSSSYIEVLENKLNGL